ncbi:MAG: DNA repair exonuclease [Pseudomonadota bacterium]|nr:DNA repair exonuclease [Pseudomonadota bacterium]
MKFIHAADIHLDSPLRGLARYEGAPVEQVQNATREAFVHLIHLACREAVDFVLIAGDLYDVDWKDYNTGLFFNQQMSRLREANIPVFLVLGNHDAGNHITRALQLPENVKIFSSERPETVILEQLGVALHGQSFADKVVTQNLSHHYPAALPGYFNIGLLHTALNGRQEHAPYAPCSLSDLLAHGYDYWALGHVHTYEQVHTQPWVVFAGNIQGRHVRETGAKGCTLVTVTDDAQVQLTQVALDVLRWQVCHLEVNELHQPHLLLETVRDTVSAQLQQAEGRPLALRFVIQGRCPIHAELHSDPERWLNEIRAAATDAGLGHVWVEKIKLQTQPLTDPSLSETAGPLGELVDTLRTLPQDNTILHTLSHEFRSLKNALPAEARYSNDKNAHLDPEDPKTIVQLLNSVEELLLSRLLTQE